MHTPPDERYVATQLGAIEWALHDNRHPVDDPRHVLAHIWQVGQDECEVSWMRDLALPTRYESVSDVLADVRQLTSRRTKPVPISHRPPPRTQIL